MTVMQTSWLRWQILMERWQGLDFTRVNLQPRDLGLDENEVEIPAPSGDKFLVRAFADLQVRADDAIVDIGCAKGSALRRLLEFPFARSDGLELSPTLADIARSNFRRLGTQRIEVFCLDARSFTRYGDYNFFYLYNPFSVTVLDAVLQQISAQAVPGKEQIVVYNNPVGHDVMLRHGFAAMRRYPDFWGHGIQVYSNQPLASRLGAARLPAQQVAPA